MLKGCCIWFWPEVAGRKACDELGNAVAAMEASSMPEEGGKELERFDCPEEADATAEPTGG